jgi:hypothetical protein
MAMSIGMGLVAIVGRIIRIRRDVSAVERSTS